MLDVLKSGGQWRVLPKDFPNWRTGYQYFQQWSEKPDSVADSLLEEVFKKSWLARSDAAMVGQKKLASVSWLPKA